MSSNTIWGPATTADKRWELSVHRPTRRIAAELPRIFGADVSDYDAVLIVATFQVRLEK